MDLLPIRALAAFARTPQLTAQGIDALTRICPDLCRILDPQTLAAADIPPEARAYLNLPDERVLEADLEWIAASGAHLLAATDPGFPPELLAIPDAPAVLYVLGDAAVLNSRQLAMVGSRGATPAGRTTAHHFARCFAKAGVTVTSGLAVGIDAASHEGALAGGGCTVAVCATGLDRIYPTQHQKLAGQIRDHGALVSEFPPGTPAAKYNFPRRNRLISGLSAGVLVVEATDRSGSLGTARHARRQGKKLFAIPGSIHSPQSRGCHQLLREGARLAASVAEVLSELGIPFQNEELRAESSPRRRRRALDKRYQMLLDAVGFEPATMDVIGSRMGLPGEAIAPMLQILELEGLVAPYSGGQFCRIP